MNLNFFYKTIFFSCIFCHLFSGYTMAIDYQKIINHVNNTPNSVTNSTTKLSIYLSKPYSTDKEKLASIYYWIAKNISYNQALAAKPLYYENVDEIIDQVMNRKNGVCQHYAELFTRLSVHAGLKAFVVNGYTRSKGKVDDLSHAWNIVKVANKWYFIDATWAGASTQTISKNQFPQQFFMLTPEENIKTRMPFDPMWQALLSPAKYQEFDNGTFNSSKKGKFNFNDTIRVYYKLSQIEQHQSLVRRINTNGIFNKLVKREHAIMFENYNMLLYNQEVVKYNQGTQHYNKGMHYYNQYARTKNNKSNYYKKSRAQLMTIIDSAMYNLNRGQELFSVVKTDNSEMRVYITKNQTNIKKIIGLLRKEHQYVEDNFN